MLNIRLSPSVPEKNSQELVGPHGRRNAGVSKCFSPVSEMPTADWCKLVAHIQRPSPTCLWVEGRCLMSMYRVRVTFCLDRRVSPPVSDGVTTGDVISEYRFSWCVSSATDRKRVEKLAVWISVNFTCWYYCRWPSTMNWCASAIRERWAEFGWVCLPDISPMRADRKSRGRSILERDTAGRHNGCHI